jgi:hypothetical protein
LVSDDLRFLVPLGIAHSHREKGKYFGLSIESPLGRMLHGLLVLVLLFGAKYEKSLKYLGVICFGFFYLSSPFFFFKPI